MGKSSIITIPDEQGVYAPYESNVHISLKEALDNYVTRDESVVESARLFYEHVNSLRRLHQNASYGHSIRRACKNTETTVLQMVIKYINRALLDVTFERTACYRGDSDHGSATLKLYLNEIKGELEERT